MATAIKLSDMKKGDLAGVQVYKCRAKAHLSCSSTGLSHYLPARRPANCQLSGSPDRQAVTAHRNARGLKSTRLLDSRI